QPPIPLKRFLIKNTIEQQSNPFYEQDLTLSDNIWDVNKIVKQKTILIITGCHIFCELLDRPVAEYLKREIDIRGNYKTGRRAVIMGDRQFLADTDESRNNSDTPHD